MHIGKPEPDQLDPPHPLAPVLKTSESKETHRKIWKIHENPLETKVYIWENHPEMEKSHGKSSTINDPKWRF